MTSFPALLTTVRSCDICKAQLPMGPRPVLQAAIKARILIAGQAPGRKVHESGVPFDDASGDRLRLWLGMSREEFYDPRQVAILPMGFLGFAQRLGAGVAGEPLSFDGAPIVGSPNLVQVPS